MHVVLVCGDRNWSDREALYRALDGLHADHRITRLVEGEAKGADTMAREWAETRGVLVDPYPADWKRYGRSAGPRRNTQMLVEGQPNLVVAFHPNIAKSKGTANMVRQASAAGIPVMLFDAKGIVRAAE